MGLTDNKKGIFEQVVELLELPDSAYEKAVGRYSDLGEWFAREESRLKGYHPHVFSQGSFRLGTAIRPLGGDEEYDLDLACNLRNGFDWTLQTQEQLQLLLKQELELYRAARNIEQPIEKKHRCLRIEYKDKLSFHMDIVPCIPLISQRRQLLQESLVRNFSNQELANSVAGEAVCITDDRHPGFSRICQDWNVSNPAGYAVWFESRMNQLKEQMFQASAKIEAVPYYNNKTILQRSIQLLKRHRDSWGSSSPDSKPISIIITTLAARAYQGEATLSQAMSRILSEMDKHINSIKPRIPNPVNPEEDFADRWSMSKYAHLRLEDHFFSWLTQARRDFLILGRTAEIDLLTENLRTNFGLKGVEGVEQKLRGVTDNSNAPKTYSVSPKNSTSSWKNELIE